MSTETTKPKRIRTGRLRRESEGAMVEFRGQKRKVVAELDPKNGTVSVYLYGCRKRRIYSLVDLYLFGAQQSLL